MHSLSLTNSPCLIRAASLHAYLETIFANSKSVIVVAINAITTATAVSSAVMLLKCSMAEYYTMASSISTATMWEPKPS